MGTMMQIRTGPLVVDRAKFPLIEHTLKQLEKEQIRVSRRDQDQDIVVQLECNDHIRPSAPHCVHMLIEDLGAHIKQPAKVFFQQGGYAPEEFYIAATAQEIRDANRREHMIKAAEHLQSAGEIVLAQTARDRILELGCARA